MMANTSYNRNIPEQNNHDGYMPPPKPSSPDPQHFEAELTNVVPPSTDLPPPYPSGPRTGRRARASTTRSARRVVHVSDDSCGESEMSPLLNGHHRRTTSHSSTVHSVQSLAHTVISSSKAIISLFQTDPDPLIVPISSTSDLPFSARAKRYFTPLTQRPYYAALFHLLFINFPFELAAWIFLFVGTLAGTTLLITLPIGLIVCFLDLLGARILARTEIALQRHFHGPLIMSPPHPLRPILSSMCTSSGTETSLEHGQQPQAVVPESFFLRRTFLVFCDPMSYQALFYFLVMKPGLTLLITVSLVILVPPAFILVVPAPAVLRAVRRVGIWQADVAIDALS